MSKLKKNFFAYRNNIYRLMSYAYECYGRIVFLFANKLDVSFYSYNYSRFLRGIWTTREKKKAVMRDTFSSELFFPLQKRIPWISRFKLVNSFYCIAHSDSGVTPTNTSCDRFEFELFPQLLSYCQQLSTFRIFSVFSNRKFKPLIKGWTWRSSTWK